MGALLISETKLKDFTNINRNVDMNLLKASVEIAQDVSLQPVLGTKFYDHLLAQVTPTGSTFNADELELVNDYISKFLIQEAYYQSMSSIQFRVMNRGIVTGEMENATAVDTETFKYLRGLQAQRSRFYLMRLQDYLTIGLGQNLFPLYLQQNSIDGMIANKQAGYIPSISLPQASRHGWDLNQYGRFSGGGNGQVYSEQLTAFWNCPECIGL